MLCIQRGAQEHSSVHARNVYYRNGLDVKICRISNIMQATQRGVVVITCTTALVRRLRYVLSFQSIIASDE